jgi:hypothetical protein
LKKNNEFKLIEKDAIIYNPI